MKTTQILRYVLYSTIVSVLGFAMDVNGQAAAPILLARWSSETADTIGLTDGEFAGIYDSDFSLIQSFTLPPIPSSSQISSQASIWSPNLEYIHRRVLYDDTYTGPGPAKVMLQVWQVDTQQLVFEYFGLSSQPGVIWNQQSTRLAFAIPTGLGSDNLLIVDTAGNQIAELTPPISGLIDRIAWNSDGNLIAFNTNKNLHIWNFALNQYLPSPTDNFRFDALLRFSTISNQLAYVRYDVESKSDEIVIWDTDTSQEVGQLLGYQGMIYTFDWKSTRIVSVGLDDTVRIWNSQTLQQVAEYPRGFITQVQLSPDANTLLTNGPETSTFQTVNPLTGQVLSTNYCAITIAAGDVPGLISAIDAANANPDPDRICLAAGSTYTLTAFHNTTSGANGIPTITTDITWWATARLSNPSECRLLIASRLIPCG
jgi:WD40 repeat protein